MTISPAETTHDERVGSTLYASIWLIFLAFPVVGLLRSAHGPAAMAVGVGLLLLFAVARARSRMLGPLYTGQHQLLVRAHELVCAFNVDGRE